MPISPRPRRQSPRLGPPPPGHIDLIEDNVYPHWDVAYTNDGLERLTEAKRGTWGGSSISSPVHDEQWTLSQTGNWENYKLDLNGDTDFTDTNELDDDETFNTVNELTARDTDSDSTDDYTLSYDAAGNLTDDGKDYKFAYDAFGRLVQVKNRSNVVVSEYTYNGLGYRTGWHYDVDGTVESNGSASPDDPWYQFAYDTRWRLTATYWTSHYSTWTVDTDNPKEQFVYNNAGVGGSGGSSYIDSVILRDRDANTAWESQADGTLEERTYYCQNWRADVVALMTDAGQLVNQVRYDPYGVPFGIPKSDMDGDGDADGDDATLFNTYYTAGTMPFADWNWDGTKNTTDFLAYLNDRSADSTLGRGDLSYAYSRAGGASRKGYAGYEIDPVLTGSEGWESVYHVRHRVLLSQLGRWTRRDPMGYVDGMSVYEYGSQTPSLNNDPSGTALCKSGSCGGAIGSGGGNSGASSQPEPPPSSATIPSCPPNEPHPGTTTDGWVPDPNAYPATGDPDDDHCGLSCWRSVGRSTQGGQQCCYNPDGSLNTNPDCMGTIDLWGVCPAETRHGNCCWWCSFRRLWRHYQEDVLPYEADPRAYNEAQCCLRSCGVPSGTSGGDGVTDDELHRQWEICQRAVRRGLRFCSGRNDCDDIDRPDWEVLPHEVPGVPSYGQVVR